MGEKLTRKDVSTKYKIPIRTVDYLVSTNQIPFSRIGKRLVRFDYDRLEQWFEEREGVEFRHKKQTAIA